jgi:trk system potassium uptake protein TrkA|tara:strand:- start:1900 stop:2127 length:228 start_codon:yes stop_codon:yes gene_type:complete
LIEAEAMETSSLVGVPLKEASLPEGVLVGAIVRDDKVTMPRGSTVVSVNDRVVLFAANESVKQVEQLFSVGLEFF